MPQGFTPSFATTDTTSLLLSAFVILVSLWILINQIRVILHILSNGQPEWTRDVSDEKIPLPEHYKDTDKQLRSSGMEEIGVTQAKFRNLDDVGYEWAYKSANGEFYVEVVYDTAVPVLVQAMSCYADNAMLITRFPLGENIVTANYISRFVNTDIEAAITHHQQQIDLWEAQHGRPLPANTLEEVNRYDEVFRLNHRRKDFQRLLKMSYIQIAAALATIVAQGALLLVFLTNNLEFYSPTWLVTGIITVAAFGAYIYVFRSVKTPPHALES